MSSVRKENPFGRKAAQKRKANPFGRKKRQPTLDELAAKAKVGDKIADGVYLGHGGVLTSCPAIKTDFGEED